MSSSVAIADLISAAQAAEAEANFSLAIQHWQEVVRRDPSNLAARTALAPLLLESGDPAAAVTIYEPVALALPDDDDVQRTFLDLLLAAGQLEWARRHADYADLRKEGRAFRAYVEAAATPSQESPAPQPFCSSSPTHTTTSYSTSFEPLFSHDHALRLATLFQGRADAYARQWVNEEGATGYSPVYQPYTPRVVLNHLLGNFTVGIYLLRPDGHARVLAFDFDITAAAIEAARGSASKAAELRAAVTAYASQAATSFRSHGLITILEDSGYKGVHIWCCFDDWLTAARLRRLGQALLATLPPPPDTISVEIFPKQKGNPVKLGNLIKLPLGIHRKTGRRSLLLDAHGAPFEDQPSAILALAPTPAQIVDRLLQSLNPPQDPPPPHISRPVVSQPAPADPSTSSAHAAFPTYSEADFRNDPALGHLLKHCPLLNALVTRIRSTQRISYDERIVIEHTLGHLPNGPAIVNFLFRPCENFDSAFLMRRPHRGYPISCTKMIARLSYLPEAASCSCSFAHACANYPTPLNHLYSLVPKPEQAAPVLLPPHPQATPTTAFDVAHALNSRGATQRDNRPDDPPTPF